jgi:amino acid adenylation domain-containing protein
VSLRPDLTLIHEPVWHWAERTPEAPAVVGSRGALSYSTLARQAGRLARALQDLGFSRGARAALLMDGSVECCLGMLACLRAGGCYLPLGVTHPPARLAAVIRDALPEVVMTVSAHCSLLVEALDLAGVNPKAVILLDGPESSAPQDSSASQAPPVPPVRSLPCRVLVPADFAHASDPLPCPSIGQDLAYILYTSGSTGQPKGVMVRHANVRAYLGWMAGRFGITQADRLSGHASPTFDISVHDIFGAFFSGASVHPLETQAQKAFPGPFIASRGITCWNSVPSVIAMMIRSRQLTQRAFPSLRLAVFAGEPLAPALAEAWMAALPHCDLFNNYGPTEATVVVTCHRVERVEPGRPIPIGKPTSPTECLILSSGSDLPAAPGQPGRLVVRGGQVSAGYWRRPDLTAEAFLPNPLQPDINDTVYDTGDLAFRDEAGVIHYLGRADDQVKIRGQRVELGEVEAALAGQPGVIEAAVLAVAGEEELELVACVSGPASSAEGGSEVLLGGLSELLPPYMVPLRVLFFPELPVNSNGKTDRKALGALLERLRG